MNYFGPLLYLLFAVLLVWFGKKARGLSLAELIARRTGEHHRVHDAMARHPRGGTWKEHCRWMQEEHPH
jgi:hypothetical protein